MRFDEIKARSQKYIKNRTSSTAMKSFIQTIPMVYEDLTKTNEKLIVFLNQLNDTSYFKGLSLLLKKKNNDIDVKTEKKLIEFFDNWVLNLKNENYKILFENNLLNILIYYDFSRESYNNYISLLKSIGLNFNNLDLSLLLYENTIPLLNVCLTHFFDEKEEYISIFRSLSLIFLESDNPKIQKVVENGNYENVLNNLLKNDLSELDFVYLSDFLNKCANKLLYNIVYDFIDSKLNDNKPDEFIFRAKICYYLIKTVFRDKICKYVSKQIKVFTKNVYDKDNMIRLILVLTLLDHNLLLLEDAIYLKILNPPKDLSELVPKQYDFSRTLLDLMNSDSFLSFYLIILIFKNLRLIPTYVLDIKRLNNIRISLLKELLENVRIEHMKYFVKKYKGSFNIPFIMSNIDNSKYKNKLVYKIALLENFFSLINQLNEFKWFIMEEANAKRSVFQLKNISVEIKDSYLRINRHTFSINKFYFKIEDNKRLLIKVFDGDRDKAIIDIANSDVLNNIRKTLSNIQLDIIRNTVRKLLDNAYKQVA